MFYKLKYDVTIYHILVATMLPSLSYHYLQSTIYSHTILPSSPKFSVRKKVIFVELKVMFVIKKLQRSAVNACGNRMCKLSFRYNQKKFCRIQAVNFEQWIIWINKHLNDWVIICFDAKSSSPPCITWITFQDLHIRKSISYVRSAKRSLMFWIS